MEEAHENTNKEYYDKQHANDHNDQISRPSMKYKWFFTIVFIPICLFAISHHLANQISTRGEDYNEFSLYADAARQYRKAVFLNKNDMESRNYLAFSYKMLGEYGKAVDVYEKILNLDPQNLSATHDLAMSYAMKEDYENAIKTFRKLNEMILTTDRLNPEEKIKHHEKTTSLLVTCYEKMGNLDEARSVIQEYLITNPDSLIMKEKLMRIGKDSVKQEADNQ